MVTRRDGVVRVGFDEPIVLLRHLGVPDGSQAAAEVAAARPLLEAGGRAVLVHVEQTIPPPPFSALGHYRKLIEADTSLECIAMVHKDGGFGATIALGALAQLIRLTRLSGRMSGFTELGPACAWLARELDTVIDPESIEERFDELLDYRPPMASVG